MGTDGAALTQRVKSRFAQPEQFVAGIDRLMQVRERVSNELVAFADGRVFERDYVPMLSDGVYRGQLWAYRDVTARERDRAALEKTSMRNRRISMTDELTGLHNRRGFLLAAEHYLSLARREERQTLLFFLDLNGLKRINDTFGHDMGDQSLRDMAAILKKTFRDSDILGRVGGDEFVVLVSMDEAHGALTNIRLRERMTTFNAHGGRPYTLDTSIGAVVHTSEESLDQLLARGDAAMYVEKRAGKPASA
jgi:diguanylate cyclase (GGDEF)-like protein